MQKSLAYLVLTTALITTCGISNAKGPKVPYDHPGMTENDQAHEAEVNWVSVDDIKKSLEGKAPTKVGLDIDDTALVSSQCFYYGKNKWSPDSHDYLHNQDFWDYVADDCDLSSIPKESTKKLIEMHQNRGDQIIFITGRTPSRNYDGKSLDGLGKILEKTFNIKNMQPVIYTRDIVKEPFKYDKSPYIKQEGITIFYGDSDSDIHAAREVGARGIRVIRPAVSTNKPLPLNGGYGEEVVRDSWY
ncbi:acid phosphatase AphA [Suttonella ornithocola]|uniref:Class B acid phosphatase n=1 Tax=Suttonella ornithocola TaxID=279832 RepID=A0A380MNS2_9GAMM|nr:acid phosphatase AphA [Suttonella ornithocola]SUO93908.1 Class B acid phosphatase precursor [Suttonella ornithocola]